MDLNLTVKQCKEIYVGLQRLPQTGVELSGLAMYDMACNKIALRPIVEAYDEIKDAPEWDAYAKALVELQRSHAAVDERKRYRFVIVDGVQRPIMRDEDAYQAAAKALEEKHASALAAHKKLEETRTKILKAKKTVSLVKLPRDAFADTRGSAEALDLLELLEPILEVK